MYVVKRTVDYPDGFRSEGYIKSVSLLVTFTGKISEAKQYRTKADAKKDIKAARAGRHKVKEGFEIISA